MKTRKPRRPNGRWIYYILHDGILWPCPVRWEWESGYGGRSIFPPRWNLWLAIPLKPGAFPDRVIIPPGVNVGRKQPDSGCCLLRTAAATRAAVSSPPFLSAADNAPAAFQPPGCYRCPLINISRYSPAFI